MVTPHRPPSDSEISAEAPAARLLSPEAARATGLVTPDPPSALAEARELSARGLQGFGLTHREARLYLAMLRAGPVPARTASELSGLQRATSYRLVRNLLSRGLVRGDGRWPQCFHPLPAHALYERMEQFLADEIELRKWLDRMLPEPDSLARPGGWFPALVPRSPGGNGSRPAANFASWTLGGIGHPLGLFRAAVRRIDALLRPSAIARRTLNPLTVAFLRAIQRGCRVRLVFDCGPSDNRFVDHLLRSAGPNSPLLEVRRFTPLPTNLGIIDGSTAFRFPGMGASARYADVGLTASSAEFVSAQVVRFEAVWGEAVVARPPRSLARRIRRGAADPRDLMDPTRARLVSTPSALSR